jgi:hypothetical protein
LQAAILAAQLQQVLEKVPEQQVAAATSAADPADSAKQQPREVHWWHEPGTGAALRGIWAQGRSGTAEAAARSVGASGLDPASLAAVIEKQLSYNAPEAPPPAQRPDYKYMQGDKRRKRRHKK